MSKNRLGRRAQLSAVAALAVAGAALIGVSSGSARSAAGPTLQSEPTITGAAVVGESLEGNKGLWQSTKDISYKYQWLQCNAEPADDSSSKTCRTITGATRDDYTVGSDDLGKRIRFRVTAKNSGGSTTATSAATSVVINKGDKPASTYPPVIYGSAIVGETLKTTTGSWVGTKPLTFSYRWGRCDKLGNACVEIEGATAASYKIKGSDTNKTFRTRVVAKNAQGKADAYSAPSDVVVDPGGSGGIIELPSGEKSVDAKDIPKDQRLVVDRVVFSPSTVTSATAPILVQIRVKDTRGYAVRNATVFIRSTPKVTSGGDGFPTATDGWVSYQLIPESDFVVRNGYSVQFYVKAYRKGDPSKGGIYGSSLVQVATKQP